MDERETGHMTEMGPLTETEYEASVADAKRRLAASPDGPPDGPDRQGGRRPQDTLMLLLRLRAGPPVPG